MKSKFLCAVLAVIFMVTAAGNGYAMSCCAAESGGGHGEHSDAGAVNTICPVSGEPVNDDPAASYVYKGKTYKFCCPSCIIKFKQNPEKYISAMPAAHEEHKH